MEKPFACVIVSLEPTTVAEDEFQDWYDHEHIPQRKAVPGLVTAERFICISGWPRYLALFDWNNIDVLSTPECRTARDVATRTPWTRRIMSRVRGWIREETVQIYPGRAHFGAAGQASRLVLARLPSREPAEEIVASIERGLANVAGVRQWRMFGSTDPSRGEYWIAVECDAEWTVIERMAEVRSFDLVNVYMRYWRNP